MPPQGMAFGQGGVVELAQKLHAEFLHDPLRTQVRDGREGYQFFDAQLCGERYAGLCRFRCITLIPPEGASLFRFYPSCP